MAAQPTGENGGQVLREIKLHGIDYPVGEVIPAKVLMGLPLGNRTALRDTGVVRMLEEAGQSPATEDDLDELREMVVHLGALIEQITERLAKAEALVSKVPDLRRDVGNIKAAQTRSKK